jgi:hypothetical protein
MVSKINDSNDSNSIVDLNNSKAKRHVVDSDVFEGVSEITEEDSAEQINLK